MKLTMNAGSTWGTAILRGAYQAAGSGMLVFLITWGATDQLKGPIVAGGVAALAALGFRGGVEGASDASRDAKKQVLSGDVGQPNK